MTQVLLRKYDSERDEAGDFITEKPDDFDGWGKKERHGGNFVIIKITDLAYGEARKYFKAHYSPEGEILTRKVYKVLVKKLPAAFKKKLKDTSYVEVTKAQLKNFIYNKITQQTGD